MRGELEEAGQNVGRGNDNREIPVPTAFDLKEVHLALAEFSSDELKQIPILPEGAPLEYGVIYLDLADATREPFRASGGTTATRGHFFVEKDRVPGQLWSRLVASD